MSPDRGSYYIEDVCGYSPTSDGPLCGRPVEYTIRWDGDPEKALSCAEHAAQARVKGGITEIRTADRNGW